MRNLFFLILFCLIVLACKKIEARKPKQHTTQNFYKELIEANKKIITKEIQYIKHFIKQDTLNYQTSASGFWYTYNKKIIENLPQPKAEDLVVLEYTITDLAGNILYPKQEKIYKVDKQDFIPALQDGIKLMKKGETITFVIPSYRGFGVVGDGNKIGINQTIKSTVTLINIKKTKNEIN